MRGLVCDIADSPINDRNAIKCHDEVSRLYIAHYIAKWCHIAETPHGLTDQLFQNLTVARQTRADRTTPKQNSHLVR